MVWDGLAAAILKLCAMLAYLTVQRQRTGLWARQNPPPEHPSPYWLVISSEKKSRYSSLLVTYTRLFPLQIPDEYISQVISYRVLGT